MKQLSFSFTKKKRPMDKYNEDLINEWAELFKSGVSYRQIAARYDTPYPTVFWHMKKLGLSGHRNPGRKKTYPGLSAVEVARQGNLKQYGISLEDFTALLDFQDGVCAMCSEAAKGGKTASKNLHVDHDHLSGEIRGLLCNNCNSGLGKFRDRCDLLVKGVEYLEDPPARAFFANRKVAA